MKTTTPKLDRRLFLRQVAFTSAALTTPGLLAEELTRTARQTEGPFYPDKLPLDTDNDLLVLNDALTPAVGQITHLTGRVLSSSGEPVRGAVVEIWQVDNKGAYIHSQSESPKGRDGNFQGFGRFLTGTTGEYYFRTIKPVPYVPRTPHIHVAINQGGKRMLTTQLYVKGEKGNERDPIYRAVRDPKAKESITVDFKSIPDSAAGELAARFDVVIGQTPEEDGQPRNRRRRPRGRGFGPGRGRQQRNR